MIEIAAVEDFENFLMEFQIDRALMNSQISDVRDLIQFPAGSWPVELHSSPIHGLGLFANRCISAGEWIAPARYQGMRTPAGRYTNHHPLANAVAIADGSDIWFMAVQPVAGGAEVLVNYRQVLRVNLATADYSPNSG